jgi:hypothetical protein
MDHDDTRILVCPTCGNQTPHKLVFRHEYEPVFYGEDGTQSEGPAPPSIYMVFECGTCRDISLYEHPAPVPFEEAILRYPKGDSLHESVPRSVATNFQEARRIQTVSPNGFAVLIRRALEAMCDDRGVPADRLQKRLEVLANRGEIPPVLAEITSVLRTIGNSGAHNTNQDVTVPMTWAMEEFFRALVEYVYVAPFLLRKFKSKSDSVASP